MLGLAALLGGDEVCDLGIGGEHLDTSTKTDGMPRRAAVQAAPFPGGRFHLNASRDAERRV